MEPARRKVPGINVSVTVFLQHPIASGSDIPIACPSLHTFRWSSRHAHKYEYARRRSTGWFARCGRFAEETKILSSFHSEPRLFCHRVQKGLCFGFELLNV